MSDREAMFDAAVRGSLAERDRRRREGLPSDLHEEAVAGIKAAFALGRTEAERIDPTEHLPDDDPRYDGFRIHDYWILTNVGSDNQEAPLFVTPPQARAFHLSIGPAMASDERRAHHLRQYAAWMAEGNPGLEFRLRHFVPEGEPEIFGGV